MAQTLTTIEDSDDEIPMLFADSHRHSIANDYEMMQELGVGKFSVVRMAEHKKTKTKVAIKQIDRKVCPAELLVKEVEIMRVLGGCPGVIHLIDVYEDPQSPKTYLVMELVTGGELFDYIVKSSSYSEKSASDYIRQLCQTVEYLHTKNIVHRDLKPENMLFEDPSAQVLKLCDFGLADTLKDDFDFLTLAVGTKSYMAPEVSSNMGYGKPVDMYSIGVILYILLCGYLPIDPENGIYVLEFPPSEWSDISIEVKLLIKRLLDDSPAARPTASVVLKHPWIRGTNTSTKPLVGTLRNLKSWNQVGGRAVTKPRGQVMNLFDNPPTSSSAHGGGLDDSHTSNDTTTTNSSSYRDVERSSRSSKGERAPSPKVRDGRMQKTKKAALPKMIDGVMTPPPSPVKDTSSSHAASSAAVSAASPTAKRKTKTGEKDKAKLKPSTASTESSASPSPSKSKTSKRKAEERDSKTPSRVRPSESTATNSNSNPNGAGPASSTSNSNSNSNSNSTANGTASVAFASPSVVSTPTPTSTAPPSTGSASSGAPSRSSGDKPVKPVSDRTKQFLKEQEARDEAKKAAATEKSNRRRSMGTPSRKRAVEAADTAAEDADVETTSSKKDKRAAVAVISSPTLKDKKSKRKSVTAPRSANPNTNDLEAMISNALDDDDADDELKRQRSNSVATLTPVKTKKRTARGTDLTGGKDASNDSLSSSKKASKTRERSATTQQDGVGGDFSAFGSDSILAQSGTKKGSKVSVSSTNENGGGDSADYYPKRAGSKPAASKSREKFATPASSPSSSPPEGSVAPVMKVTVRKSAKGPVSPGGSSNSVKSSRSSGNVRSNKDTTSSSKAKTSFATKGGADDSDSDSYGTGQSSSASYTELAPIATDHAQPIAKKKKAPTKKAPSRSPSTSSD